LGSGPVDMSAFTATTTNVGPPTSAAATKDDLFNIVNLDNPLTANPKVATGPTPSVSPSVHYTNKMQQQQQQHAAAAGPGARPGNIDALGMAGGPPPGANNPMMMGNNNNMMMGPGNMMGPGMPQMGGQMPMGGMGGPMAGNANPYGNMGAPTMAPGMGGQNPFAMGGMGGSQGGGGFGGAGGSSTMGNPFQGL